MKLYTKRGDDGMTDLIGGSRVPKHHPRVAAYGGVDELNAMIGLALAGCEMDALRQPLITAQGRLFDLGAQLATPRSDQDAGARITADHARQLEQQIDAVSDRLPPLRSFILPGGTDLAARLHAARTVCRRAERGVAELAQAEPIDPAALVYLNRLADLLFALARLANAEAGVADVPWTPEK
ncbi:MAG: cob(I)yrinic acid a,c-diamide adenosyltransferase [Phycisphaeraceae bacterium]